MSRAALTTRTPTPKQTDWQCKLVTAENCLLAKGLALKKRELVHTIYSARNGGDCKLGLPTGHGHGAKKTLMHTSGTRTLGLLAGHGHGAKKILMHTD